jgi:aromatic ring hydroxylase
MMPTRDGMALNPPEQHVASLRDNWTVYCKGERVPDMTTHPVIQVDT